MIPLLVYIVFHPKSEDSRKLACSIHQMLNADAAIPGLRIPTLFVEEDGTELPPVEVKIFDTSEQVFVIVCADDYLTVGYTEPIPAGRKNWGAWTADLYEQCSRHQCCRFIPFQLTKNAFPLDQRLSVLNFPRAWEAGEDQRHTWVKHRSIIEMVRFLYGMKAADEAKPEVPLTAFLSHTKMDVKKEPRVIDALIDYLKQDQPIKTWFDSGDIPGGSKFKEKIEQGVENSALLSVLTDAYGSREWCRTEILLAKEHMRPIVVIDALQTHEVRHFPYIGNVPVLRWSNDPQAAMHLLFKETLRHLYTEKILKKQSLPGDTILTSAPELAVVVGSKEKTFLYPDPPLGREEMELIAKTGAIAETPLQRFARNRPLKDQKIAVSLSESNDLEKYGFNMIHLDQMAIEISRYLLLAGATLCYGGHLGKEGYTAALFELVRSYPVPGIEPVRRIINYAGWPLPLTVEQRAQYNETAEFVRTPRPPDISEKDDPVFTKEVEKFFPGDSPVRRFAWARGMSEMRQRQTNDVFARIVLGGKTGPTITALPDGGKKSQWYTSRVPGVLEEIIISLKHNQPVYLIGGFGGCARMVADVIRRIPRDEMNWEYQKDAPFAKEMRDLYASRSQEWLSYEEMTEFLQKAGIPGLNNNLSVKENEELFETIDPGRIIELVLKGLV